MKPSSVAAVLRIARRNIGRSRWRSALIVLLVMLPVAAMVGGLAFLQTTTPTPEVRATNFMGRADLWVNAMSSAQTSDDLRAVLPAGSQIEAITWTDGRLILPGRQLRVTVRAMSLDGLAHGMLDVIDGRLPTAPAEVAVTQAVAAIADVGLGDRIQLAGGELTSVVGLVENPSSLNNKLVLQSPTVADQPAQADSRSWLVALPAGAQLPDSVDPITDVGTPDLGPNFSAQTRAQWSQSSGTPTPGALILGSMAMIETVLVGAAAFAVSIRRRQRELGVLAATGAQPGQLAGTVLGEGILLGGLAAALGLIVGIVAVVAISPWLDQLTNRRHPLISFDPVSVALAAGVGLVAAVLASAVPAWTAARLPVLLALSGRRPPAGRARRTLLFGLVLIGLSIALTTTGAASLLAARTGPGSSNDMGLAMLVGAAILGVLGFGSCSPWLVERLELIGRRLPLAGRIAFRDTARARSRSAPIVTAMLAGLAATIAIAAFVVSYYAATDAEWQPWARPDQILLSGDEPAVAGPIVAAELGAVGSAPMPLLNETDRFPQIFFSITGSAAPTIRFDDEGGAMCDDCQTAGRPTAGDAVLLRALAAERASAALAAGKVVVLTKQPLELTEVAIVVYGGADEESGPASPEHFVVPAVAVAIGVDPTLGSLPGAVMPPEVLARLGVGANPDMNADSGNYGYVIRLDRPVTELDVTRAGLLLADYPDTRADAAFGPSHPGDVARWAVTILSFLLALSVTAIAVALGEAESRSDQRTLLALGAAPGIRRRIAAARAGVLAILAGLLAVPAGLLPVWGLLASRGVPLVVPVTEIMVAVALLPVAAIVGALLLSRPIPAWSAFRDTAA